MAANLVEQLRAHLTSIAPTWVDEMPPETEGLLVVDTGGPSTFGPEGRYTATVQVTARYRSPQEARVKSWAVWDGLADKTSLMIGTVKAIQVKATQQPFRLPVDERNYHRSVCNYQITIRK